MAFALQYFNIKSLCQHGLCFTGSVTEPVRSKMKAKLIKKTALEAVIKKQTN